MPQLVEYVNKENITPTDRGTEARVQEGRRVGVFFNQRAESLRDFGNRTAQQIGGAIRDAGDAAVAYSQHRELNQGADTYWQKRSDIENAWDETVKGNPDKGIPPADPHDPTVQQRFMEERVKPDLQQWGDTFHTEAGQRFAQERISSLTGHMYEKTAADMGSLAAQQIDTTLRSIGNRSANIAHDDPSAVDHLLEDIKSSVDTMVTSSSNLKGAHAGKVRTELTEKYSEQAVKAGALGAISKSRDPEKTADEWRRKFPQYITGDVGERLSSNARTQIRAQRVDRTYADHLEKVQRQDISDKAEEGYLQKLFSDDIRDRSSVTTRAIANDPRLTKAAKEHFISIVERELKPAKADAQSRVNWLNFTKEIGSAGDEDHQKIKDRLDEAYGNGTLTKGDWKELRQDLERMGTPDGSALAKDRNFTFAKFERSIDIAKSPRGEAMPSALGQQNMARAMADAKAQEEVLRHKGIDPRELYRYGSPNFFFRAENLRKYQASMAEITAYDAALRSGKPTSTSTTAAPVAPPPEKPADFNQRFGFDAAATVNRPPAEREAGKTYPTPRGPMKWTGTGWVQP